MIHVNDTPTFRVKFLKADQTPLDISLATFKRVKFQTPEGVVLLRDLTFVDPTNGIAEYQTLSTDFASEGIWSRQYEVGFPDGKVFCTEEIPFHVRKRL